MKRYLLPALVAGFGAGVLSVVPVVNTFTCCLFVPLAAYIALVLDLRASGNYYQRIDAGHAVLIGLLTGVSAGLFSTAFEVIVTAVTKSNDLIEAFGNMQSMINSLPVDQQIKKQVIDLIASIVDDLKTTGFSLIYTISMLFNNLILDVIFGLAGGLIGRQFINMRIDRNNSGR